MTEHERTPSELALDMIRGAAPHLGQNDLLSAVRMLVARIDGDEHGDELQRIADNLGRARYFAYVRAIAEELDTEARDLLRKGEDPDDVRETVDERLHETVDGSGWVIYTADAIRVLLYSDNDSAAIDDFGPDVAFDRESYTGVNWSVMAYGALRQDIAETMTDVDTLAEDVETERESAADSIRDALGTLSEAESEAVDSLRDDPTDYDAAGRLLFIVPGAADAIRVLLGLAPDETFPDAVESARAEAEAELNPGESEGDDA